METSKETMSTIELIKRCDGLIGEIGNDTCIILKLQNIKNILANNQDALLESLKPKYTNFFYSIRITGLYNYLDWMFNSENKNRPEIVLVTDTFQEPYKSKSVKQYLQIKNINNFPNAEMAFSI